MNERRSSYMWRAIGAAGQNRLACLHAAREIGEVWRTLGRNGFTWMGKSATTGEVVSAAKREEVGHLLRKLEVTA